MDSDTAVDYSYTAVPIARGGEWTRRGFRFSVQSAVFSVRFSVTKSIERVVVGCRTRLQTARLSGDLSLPDRIQLYRRESTHA